MLCLHDSIRQDDPDVQQQLATISQAQTLTALVAAAWALALHISVRVIEAVLAERAQLTTSWPPCPQCGKPLHSKGRVQRELTT